MPLNCAACYKCKIDTEIIHYFDQLLKILHYFNLHRAISRFCKSKGRFQALKCSKGCIRGPGLGDKFGDGLIVRQDATSPRDPAISVARPIIYEPGFDVIQPRYMLARSAMSLVSGAIRTVNTVASAVGAAIPAIAPGGTLPTVAVKEDKADGPAPFSSPPGKHLIVGVPGAFTGTCHAQVPGYISQFDAFKAKGVNQISVVSVNDVFVTKYLAFPIVSLIDSPYSQSVEGQPRSRRDTYVLDLSICSPSNTPSAVRFIADDSG